MSPAALVTLLALLTAVFLLIVAALLWQEARARSTPGEAVYVVEDAVGFIVERLAPPTAERMRRADVRRVIEWEVFYLQGLAQKNRRNPVDTVAGGDELAVSWIIEQMAEKNGVSYPREDIEEVLRREAEYLDSIGVVGDPVDGGELK